MRPQRMLMIAGGCGAILGAGFIVAPKELPTVTTTGGGTGSGTTFDGTAVENARGVYQVQIVVEGGRVTEVRPLQAGTADAESRFVNERALPELERRMLDAQTWDVEYVSGASFTSPGIVASAKAAFQKAGLG